MRRTPGAVVRRAIARTDGGATKHVDIRDVWNVECIAVEETIFTNTPCEFNVKDVLPHTVTARAFVQPDLCHCLCLCSLVASHRDGASVCASGFVPLFAPCTRRAARPDRGAQDEGCRMHSTDVASAPRRAQAGTPHGIEHAKHVIFRSVCGFAPQGTSAREPKRVCLVFGRLDVRTIVFSLSLVLSHWCVCVAGCICASARVCAGACFNENVSDVGGCRV